MQMEILQGKNGKPPERKFKWGRITEDDIDGTTIRRRTVSDTTASSNTSAVLQGQCYTCKLPATPSSSAR